MPDLPLVRQALRQAELVVVQDCFANIDTMAYADVALPATTWGEKQGTVTNTERRISRVRPAVPAPGQARDDWRIAIDFGQRLQARLHPDEPDLFAWPDQASLYDEYCRLTAGRDLDISGLSHALLECRMRRTLLRANETAAHLHAIGAQHHRSQHLLTRCNTTSGNYRNVHRRLHRRYGAHPLCHRPWPSCPSCDGPVACCRLCHWR